MFHECSNQDVRGSMPQRLASFCLFAGRRAQEDLLRRLLELSLAVCYRLDFLRGGLLAKDKSLRQLFI